MTLPFFSLAHPHLIFLLEFAMSRSKDRLQRLYFKLIQIYKLIKLTLSKDEKYESNSGVIASPNWPNNYKTYNIPLYGFCDWVIELSHEK